MSGMMAGFKGHWHLSNCHKPDIQLEEHEPNCDLKSDCPLLPQCKYGPYCRACGCRPSLHDILTPFRDNGLPNSMPPDEAYGEMNLRWPSQDLYCGLTELEVVPENKVASSRTHLGCWTALKHNQFRQACLSPADQEDFPVHVSLEVYSRDNCPEYEAFSYTWNGNNSEQPMEPFCPVYVGAFWAVLPQTRNCWELLRFARFSQGIRRVWVDALCINQEDMHEKEEQIAGMGPTYRESTRVVVYLGPNYTIKPSDRFPRRYGLHNLADGEISPRLPDGSAADLQIVFRQRYFSRLWVIQELITAPRIIIRVGDTDLAVDTKVTRKLEAMMFDKWQDTPAPWFQHVTQEAFTGRDLCEALQLVSKSSCADPRDRFYGILELLEPSLAPETGFRVDYTISNQHMWIGLFAHCLLRLGTGWLLLHANGYTSPLTIPSWTPDWRSSDTWQSLQRPKLGHHEMKGILEDKLAARLGSSGPKGSYLEPLIPKIVNALCHHSRRKWNNLSKVESTTGSLLDITAIHLLHIPSAPVFSIGIGEYGLFVADLSESEESSVDERRVIYLVCRQRPFKNAGRHNDHVYMIDAEPEPILLLLRSMEGSVTILKPKIGPSVHQTNLGKNFALVAAVPYMFVSNNRQEPVLFDLPKEFPRRPSTVWMLIRNITLLLSNRIHETIFEPGRARRQDWTEDGTSKYFKPRIVSGYLPMMEVYDRETAQKRMFTRNTPLHHAICQIFPGEWTTWRSLIPLFWAMTDETDDVVLDRKLTNGYLKFFDPNMKPSIQNGCIMFSLDRFGSGTDRADSFPIIGWPIHEGKSHVDKWISWKWTGMTGYPNGSMGVNWHDWLDWQSYNRIPQKYWLRRDYKIHFMGPLDEILPVIKTSPEIHMFVDRIAWIRQVLNIETMEELEAVLDEPPVHSRDMQVDGMELHIDGDIHTINII